MVPDADRLETPRDVDQGYIDPDEDDRFSRLQNRILDVARQRIITGSDRLPNGLVVLDLQAKTAKHASLGPECPARPWGGDDRVS